MNLFRRFLNYQLILQVLLLWLLNFNDIFGCISNRYMNKDANNNIMKVPILSSTLANIITNSPDNESSIILSFQKFLTETSNWKIKLSDLKFLWIKMKEFSVKFGYINKQPCRFRKKHSRKIYRNISNDLPILTIQDIKTYLDTVDKSANIKGVSGEDKDSQSIVTENRVFSSFEHYNAMKSAMNFDEFACKSRNITFCIKDFLNINNSDSGDLSQSYPPGLLLKRCPTKCSCIRPYDECLPTERETRIEYLYLTNREKQHSTLLLVLVDHIACKCRDRCKDRKCISYFENVQEQTGFCECKCKEGFDKTCRKILEGEKPFNKTDYECIVSGKCIPPNCYYGNLSEEHLYLRHCPVQLY